MSRNQRARRKEKHFKQKRDARLRRPSKSTLWNEACDRADDLMDQELWREALEVLEAVELSHPGGNCILSRLVEVYEELGETDRLASLKSRYNSIPIFNDVVRELIDNQCRFDDDQLNDVDTESPEFLLFDFEIVYDPVEKLRSPQIQEWVEDGYEALQRGKGRQAEVLFKKCLEAEEDAPDLMNNLAAAYAMQGRDVEAHDLGREIHARWPEYLFGRIFMANAATLEGQFSVAEKYLRPMLAKKQFHITEFRALAIAYIQLEFERRRLGAAQTWVDMWKSVDPDDPDLKMFQQRIHAEPIRGLLPYMSKRLQGREV